jgi:hypothetical protein
MVRIHKQDWQQRSHGTKPMGSTPLFILSSERCGVALSNYTQATV